MVEPIDGGREAEGGFTLIELLATVAIIGILAATALAQYSAYKRQSVDAAVESGLHSARSSLEAYYGDNSYSYVGATQPVLADDYGYRAAPGFTLEILTLEVGRYVLRGCMQGGTSESFVYDSDMGKLAAESTGCS